MHWYAALFSDVFSYAVLPPLSRWLSGTVASIYLLLLPFTACIPALTPITDFLLKIVQFPAKVGEYIRDGSSGILGEYKEIP